MQMSKKLFNITALVGFMILLWSFGENDGAVLSAGQTFWIGLAGLGMFAIGLIKGGVN
jgi:hypothetical protein